MSRIGKELISALKEAKKKGLVTLEASPDVASLRKDLNLSQHDFAMVFHINPETLKKWEQKKRTPDSISRAYLKCIKEAPATISRLVNKKAQPGNVLNKKLRKSKIQKEHRKIA